MSAIALLSFLYLGCQKPVEQPVVTTSPTPTELSTASPGETTGSDSETIEKSFQEITALYERAPVGDLGYPLIEPLLSDQRLEELSALDLENPKVAKKFESETLPILRQAFTATHFFPKERLLEGESPINYRGLRSLLAAATKWAELKWEKGEREAAIEAAALPLSLAYAIKSRPETVSVNLFSSSYAEMTLAMYTDWSEQVAGDHKLTALMLANLKKFEIPLAHLQETILVDFAKISNSLNQPESRAALGIGQSDETSMLRWRSQVYSLYLSARELGQLAPESIAAFNALINSADGPIQGLVIDYPQMVTIQLHYFAKYRSLEIGLALLSPEGDSLRKLSSQELVARLFAEDPETVKMLNHLIEVKMDGQAITVVGQVGRFDLLAPGEPPTFFEYSPATPAP